LVNRIAWQSCNVKPGFGIKSALCFLIAVNKNGIVNLSVNEILDTFKRNTLINGVFTVGGHPQSQRVVVHDQFFIVVYARGKL
jgi:hypothetical protein